MKKFTVLCLAAVMVLAFGAAKDHMRVRSHDAVGQDPNPEAKLVLGAQRQELPLLLRCVEDE